MKVTRGDPVVDDEVGFTESCSTPRLKVRMAWEAVMHEVLVEELGEVVWIVTESEE